jgi:hypothetical protein
VTTVAQDKVVFNWAAALNDMSSPFKTSHLADLIREFKEDFIDEGSLDEEESMKIQQGSKVDMFSDLFREILKATPEEDPMEVNGDEEALDKQQDEEENNELQDSFEMEKPIGSLTFTEVMRHEKGVKSMESFLQV